MINVCIVEDELPAAQRLTKLLKQADANLVVNQVCDSIETAIQYLQSNPAPDLLMLDIQLGDGLSFDIFKEVNLSCPIIFTTAFDEYAIKAFELNSIDYLLKPIRIEALERSIRKFKRILNQSAQVDWQTIAALLDAKSQNFKQRFLIYAGENMHSVKTAEIAYFYSVEKSTFLVTENGRSFAVDFSLDKLAELLDPELFFRINRQYIVSFSAIKKISLLSKSRIKLTLFPLPSEQTLVSTARTSDFRTWLDR